jgi:Na+/H+-dicarboxylate symporter/ABC-type amino acid transport substrate-binding protein
VTTTVPAEPQTRRRWTLSRKIVVGLTAGIVVGLFVGEDAAILQMAADAYIKLLQMTVLPYVTGSIIAGLGGMSLAQARALGIRLAAILGLLWAIALVAVFLFPLMFPLQESAAFFSTTLVEPREPIDLVNLYIPANPFNSLANNIVPAVVLFSIVVGVALMSVPNKTRVVDVLHVINAAVAKATGFIVSLTPYGIFAIAAVAAGTLGIEDLARLQVYLVTYVGMTLLLSLWVLPGLVAAVTPIPYRAILGRTRDSLMTAFLTSSLLAVVPMLTEETKALLREHIHPAARDETLPAVIIPTSYNFPHSGKLLSLSFVLFAGWFAGATVPVTDYPRLAGAGLLVLFGSLNIAVPFLLDMVRVPSDTFQLFIVTSVINSRFGTLLAAVHTVAVAALGTCAIIGAWKIDGRKLLRYCAMTAALTIATVGGTRLLFAVVLNRPYDKDTVLANMENLRDRGGAQVFKSAADVAPLEAGGGSLLDRIHARKTLRVAYLDDSLPYAFFNARDELVGFDIEMAHQLARDLGVALELVPATRAILDRGLDPACCDLVMSGMVVTAERAVNVLFSTSYLDETVAFVTPDHARAAFSDWDRIRAMPHLRLGVPRAPYFLRQVQAEVPNAEVVPIDRMADMFAPHDPPIDAFVATAERGSAYTLRHPEYSVAVPQPRPVKVPLAYIVAGRDQALAQVLNTWIELKRKDGTIDALFGHWILGRDASRRKPRWSIARNVLHWGQP